MHVLVCKICRPATHFLSCVCATKNDCCFAFHKIVIAYGKPPKFVYIHIHMYIYSCVAYQPPLSCLAQATARQDDDSLRCKVGENNKSLCTYINIIVLMPTCNIKYRK